MNAALERYLPTAAFLGETLPYAFEITLFDCTVRSMPVVAQYHAMRRNADAIRKYIRLCLRQPTVVQNGMILNRSDLSSNGQLNKISVLLIKDEQGSVTGALTILTRLNDFIAASGLFQELLSFSQEEIDEIEPRSASYLPEEPTLDMIDRIVAEQTDAPERMTPEEKTELIVDLYDAGVFELKGAVAHATEALHMSEQSVYRYLAKIKRLRGE